MNIDAVLRHAANLWPQGRLSDAEVAAWRKSLGHIPVATEQALAVLDAVRVDRGRRSPPIQVVNQRLRAIAENEARARVVGHAAAPAAALDFERPQGLVADAIRLWDAEPGHPRFAEWKARAVASKTLTMMRSAWVRWTGQPGPYA